MYFSKNDISKLDKTSRIKTINSVSGIKPANLIGTADQQGNTNVAIFSSVVHLGSDPALLGFICRPRTAEAGHTYENIIETGNYTINHIPPKYLKNAHYTSAKLPKNVSEFNRCGFTEEYLNEFTAPFVKESHFKIGLEFREAMDIPLNGTTLIIGEIEHLIIPDIAMVNNDIDLELSESVGISGLNSYYQLNKTAQFPYARVHEMPEFRND